MVAVCFLAPFAPQIATVLPECLFREVTGFPCPTCGATRAVLALSRLDLAGALAFNPLAAAGELLFVVGGLVAGGAALWGHPLRLQASGAVLRLIALLAVTANWAWLLHSGR